MKMIFVFICVYVITQVMLACTVHELYVLGVHLIFEFGIAETDLYQTKDSVPFWDFI